MERPTVFLTGATGFVGRRLRAVLAERGYPVRALVRELPAEAGEGIDWIVGALEEPSAWAKELQGCDVVLHLAARTGNAPAAEHQRTNCEGTRTLLEHAQAEGVSRFLFMSTIAARYPETNAYPYASSKAAAENLVRQSALAWTIVRPTIITGPEAPGWKALGGMASLPMVPLFGGGAVRVQPVEREDLVEFLLAWLEANAGAGEVLEVGGPQAMSMRELLAGLRYQAKGKRSGFLPVPVRPLIAILATCERAGLRLPASAGQFYVFRYDSDANPHPLVSELLPEPRSVVSIDSIEEENDGAVSAECGALAAYLGVPSPSAYVHSRYADLVRTPTYQQPASPFDRFLLSFACRGRLAARAADVHARFFRPNALLRRRLLLLLAILESTPATEQGLDRIRSTSLFRFAAGLTTRGVASVLLLIAGLFVFLPMRLVRPTGGQA